MLLISQQMLVSGKILDQMLLWTLRFLFFSSQHHLVNIKSTFIVRLSYLHTLEITVITRPLKNWNNASCSHMKISRSGNLIELFNAKNNKTYRTYVTKIEGEKKQNSSHMTWSDYYVHRLRFLLGQCVIFSRKTKFKISICYCYHMSICNVIPRLHIFH